MIDEPTTAGMAETTPCAFDGDILEATAEVLVGVQVDRVTSVRP